MKKSNIRRLRRVAKLVGIASEILDRINEEIPDKPGDARYLRTVALNLLVMKRNLDGIAVHEEQTTPTP